jgi:hypothetical protein
MMWGEELSKFCLSPITLAFLENDLGEVMKGKA